jgi:hypothetical protein
MTNLNIPEQAPRRSSLDKRFSTSIISWQIVAAVIVAVVVALYFLFRGHALSLPPTLGALQLYREINGSEARRAIEQLHGKDVADAENLIGWYGGDSATATLYASEYSDAQKAALIYARMSATIEKGEGGFGHYVLSQINGRAVSQCLGMGQVHYFFAHGQVLYWLAVDLDQGNRALDALMGFADLQKE